MRQLRWFPVSCAECAKSRGFDVTPTFRVELAASEKPRIQIRKHRHRPGGPDRDRWVDLGTRTGREVGRPAHCDANHLFISPREPLNQALVAAVLEAGRAGAEVGFIAPHAGGGHVWTHPRRWVDFGDAMTRRAAADWVDFGDAVTRRAAADWVDIGDAVTRTVAAQLSPTLTAWAKRESGGEP